MLKNKNYYHNSNTSDTSGRLLLVEVPKTNDKKELSAEQMFAALHGIYKPKTGFFSNNIEQDHISFEIIALEQSIYFYVWTPEHLQNFIESQIYAQYSTAQIIKSEVDYTQRDFNNKFIQFIELDLKDHETIPIKTFPNFEVDPLSGITAVLSRLGLEEEMWIQILARPTSDAWREKGKKYIAKLQNNLNLPNLIKAPFQAPEGEGKELNVRDKARVTAIIEKSAKLGYEVKIRIAYLGQDENLANLNIQSLVGAFKQFNSTELNGFEQKNKILKALGDNQFKYLEEYRQRKFNNSGFVLNIEELASVFHLPHTSVDTPNVVWASAKTAEPPTNLPTATSYASEEISYFAQTNFRDYEQNFGTLRSDRGRHIYIIGQTGTGKSGLLELLALSDISSQQGYAIVDPHGDFAINNLNMIPKERIKDIVYFNPADTEYPISFNPLEVSDSRQKINVASDLVGVMKKMFDSWGPRLEYILRNTILALLDNPGSTMLDITRMLTDKQFRKKILENVKDPVTLAFWHTEFNTWDTRFQTEAVAPVLNKIGAFITNSVIRNIIGQPASSFDIRKIMDEGKILIINLSRGLIGEDNTNVLGAMLVTKVQLAAMSRANIANIENRIPFYLYVDEFQNFATDSFAVILSEARKYGLHLTLANQYINQMPLEVKNAVFGNVGTIVSFRVSPDDAPFLEKYLSPQFDTSDLIQLANRHFIMTMTIGGEKAPAFSGITLDLSAPEENHLEQIIESSRKLYAKPRLQVEEEIRKNTQTLTNINPPLSQNAKKRAKNKKNYPPKQK